MTTDNRFNFGRPYQVKLLSLCIRDRVFLNGHRELIKPSWFNDETLIDAARLVLDYFDKFKKPPTLDAFNQAITDFLEDNPNRKEKAGDYERLVREVETTTLEEWEDVTERAVLFARRMAVREAIAQNIDALSEGEYSVMEKQIRDALQVGVNKTDLGINYFDDETRFEKMREKFVISTGLTGLDDLLNGGSAPGELCIIEAPTNGFKSGALVNLCVAALQQGCDVVYMSLEITEPQIARRFDGALCNVVTFREGKERVMKEVQAMKEKLGQNLWLKSWPLGDASIQDLRGYLHTLASQGKIATGKRQLFLAVDYPQILKPVRHYNERRHEIRDNYQETLRLGVEFNSPVWAPMQTTRQAETKRLITKADLAECYAVAGDSHIILSLNQTKEEKEADEMRIFVAKSRESQAFRNIKVLLEMEKTAWREPVSELYKRDGGAANGTNYSETMNRVKKKFSKVVD